MIVDVLGVGLVLVTGGIVFRRFAVRTPMWARVLKMVLGLIATGMVSARFGHVGVLLLVAALVIPVIVVHGWLLPRRGINGWTGEPRN
jgi:hypothetical protein